MKLHSGRAGSITRRGVRTHPSSSTLSLSLQHSAVTHTVILERKRSGGDVEVEEFIHIQLQQRGKPALQNASVSLMSLHLALRSLITRLGHPFFFFFADVSLRSKKNTYLDIISEEVMFTSRNLQAQGPVKPTGCKDAALSLPTPALGIGPQPLCSLGTKIPIPPLPPSTLPL